MAGRTIAIGDIHGCSAALVTLLHAVAPQADDCLVVLGDYIDRGPDTRAAIDALLSAGKHCRLVALLGNHEEMLLDARAGDDPQALCRWLQAGGTATLDSYGYGIGPDRLPEEHAAFVEHSLPWYETGTHIFVHANYDANEPMENQSAFALRWEPLREQVPPRHISGKTVIAGHTPQSDGTIFDRGYLKCIDTHCYAGGWLTALDVADGQLWQANQQGELRQPGASGA